MKGMNPYLLDEARGLLNHSENLGSEKYQRRRMAHNQRKSDARRRLINPLRIRCRLREQQLVIFHFRIFHRDTAFIIVVAVEFTRTWISNWLVLGMQGGELVTF